MTRQEQLSCLTDRPCAVCKHHTDNGCTQWKCVFDEQPCDDAISRHAAIEIIKNWIDHDMGYSWEEKNIMRCAIVELENLPPVSVAEKTGRWIPVKGYEGLLCKCSNCCKDGERYKHRTHQSKTNFCPDCGAKMVESEE